jgi:AcrR family transcriptional regulator
MSGTEHDDRPDGRERLLRAAVRHLEQHSAAQLRVIPIAEEAEVAIGLIRHHFGSRDGLVAAAQQRRVEGATREDIAAIRLMLSGADADALWSGLEATTRATIDRARAAIRLSRFAAVATAHGRPEVREAIGKTLSDLLDELTAVVGEARERGLIGPGLQPRAIATFIQAYALGLLVHDLDPDPVDDEALVAVIMTALRAILTPA